MDDLTAMTDETLADLRLRVLTEQERRARVAAAPGQIADLTRQAVECGADPAAMRAAVEEGLSPEQLAAREAR